MVPAEWQQAGAQQLTSEALMGPALAHAQSLGAESVTSQHAEPAHAPLSGPATMEDLQASFAQLGMSLLKLDQHLCMPATAVLYAGAGLCLQLHSAASDTCDLAEFQAALSCDQVKTEPQTASAPSNT